MNNRLTRRNFLKAGISAFGACVLPLPVWAAIRETDKSSRSLAFFNTHTSERLNVCYFKDGTYSHEALNQINRILRDHRTGETRTIDTRLLEMLHTISQKIDRKCTFHIISGYRSPKTNEMLRKRTSGVAKTSYHTLGRAIDIRLPGCDTRKLKKVCLGLRAGGVGYYPNSDFVHVDTGNFRCWGA